MSTEATCGCCGCAVTVGGKQTAYIRTIASVVVDVCTYSLCRKCVRLTKTDLPRVTLALRAKYEREAIN